MAYIKARRGLSPRQIKLGLMVCVAAVVLAGMMLMFRSWLAALVAAGFAAVGPIIGLVVLQLLSRPLFKQALAARGLSYDLPLRLHLTADNLIHELGYVTQSARWNSVTDLYRTRRHWVFLVQNGAVVLPRRFFNTPDDESAFIAQAMATMTDGARGRSPDAAKIALRVSSVSA